MANSPATAPKAQNQPAHEVRLGSVKAAIWKNDTDSGVRYNVTFERLYNQDGEWRSTSSFGRDDLLVLAKVADLAHSWIMNPAPSEQPKKTSRNRRRDDADLSAASMPNKA